MADWARDAVFYHVYPLGLCGAPERNDFSAPAQPRLAELHAWIPHLREMGVTALYLGPLFESAAHGYDTADFLRVDRRLGTNATLAELTAALRAAGIRTVLDGVFHHVGRDFAPFRDLRENREGSPYRDWFAGIDFGGRSPYGDPFSYAGWRGHYELVKLNPRNPAVREHLFAAVRGWIEEFGIDGLRLDVAEDLEPAFLRDLAAFCRGLRPDFWLLGEASGGDYRGLAGPGMLDSVTNYEVYRALHCSHNDRSFFAFAACLDRQFGEGGLYRGLSLYAFADNHDVHRAASTLRESAHLATLYALLFTIPGVPSIYYGSEWGIRGVKAHDTDLPLRPCLRWPDAERDAPCPRLAQLIACLARIRHASPALRRGTYRPLHVAREQLAFAREAEGERVIVTVNAAAEPARLELAVDAPDGGAFCDLLHPGVGFTVHRGRLCISPIPPRSARILRLR
ncbi:MAG TPA: alpha-amylase family glycosyl hydrolase [Longimicrobium sp.]|jgi:glycosidase|uniref:alpha-amylase family glycosyl hydrolase n=1 Tax=Longimicrobium sp. TaxID=2029185 RepID=UPI002ED824BC